ncbi:MAG: FlgD immunoglobulin-like domain containing protein [bacterium]
MKKLFFVLSLFSFSLLFASPPTGALIVDVADVRDSSAISRAIRNALDRESERFRSFARIWETLRRMRVFQNRLPFAFDRIVYLRQNGRIILPSPSRGELTFQFQGWSQDEEQKLSAFVQLAKLIIKQVYGDPAWGGTVTVLKDTSLWDYQVFLAGVYDASTATIHMEWGRSGDIETYYRLLHLMLHAFHGPYQIGYDAWEEGIAWAATRVIFSQLFPSESFSYYCTFYLFPWYELLNQPPLSALTFWAKTQTDCSGYMTLWRHSQALSAWLKVYMEKPTFFSEFNALYYQKVQSDPATSKDLAKLKMICENIVPTVEGLPFSEWYDEQYVLRIEARFGPQLYVWNTPEIPANPDTEGYSDLIGLFYFYSTGDDERPINGTVNPRYWNYDFSVDLPVEPQYETVNIGEMHDGVGWVAPTFFNIGGPQRVTIEFPIAGLDVSIPFPYGVVGTQAEPNNICGVLLRGLGGTLTINGIDVPINQGAFGAPFPSLSTGPQKLDVIYKSPSGEIVERKINCFYGPYAVIIQPPRAKQTASAEFTKGIHMISTPLDPIFHDPAIALGIQPDKLALAHWEPIKEGTNKYLFYPNLALSLGKGYFIRFLEDKKIQLEGYSEPLEGEFSIGLAAGWNQIGYPFPEGECPLAKILVRIPDSLQPVSLDEASTLGYVAKTLWRFNPQTYGYEVLDPAKDTLKPWEGYWIRCYKDCSLIIPGPNKKGIIRNSGKSVKNLWEAKIEVQVDGKESVLKFGQADNPPPSLSLEFPPPFKEPPKAFFLDKTRNIPLAWDIKPTSPTAEWILQITAQGECLLTWSDLSCIPRGYSLLLTDLATGKKVSLLHSSHYKFEGDGTPRLFSLKMFKKNPLLISNLIAQPTRGGVEIAFTISRDGEIELRIETPSGQMVREMRMSRGAGINSVFWDGKDEKGRDLPAGVYLVKVVAYSEGERVQAIRMFGLR